MCSPNLPGPLDLYQGRSGIDPCSPGQPQFLSLFSGLSSGKLLDLDGPRPRELVHHRGDFCCSSQMQLVHGTKPWGPRDLLPQGILHPCSPRGHTTLWASHDQLPTSLPSFQHLAWLEDSGLQFVMGLQTRRTVLGLPCHVSRSVVTSSRYPPKVSGDLELLPGSVFSEKVSGAGWISSLRNPLARPPGPGIPCWEIINY